MSRPISKDHDAKRVHILTVAARLFASQGYARTSVAHVAMECAISKANIYHYYSSKEALLFDILDSYLAALRDLIIGLDLDGLDPDEQLGRVVDETLQFYAGMDHEHKMQTEGIPLLPAYQQNILKSYQRDMVFHLSDIVKRNAPTVFVDNPRKLRATVMSIFGMLNWFYMWNSSATPEARNDYAKLVTKLTLNGIQSL